MKSKRLAFLAITGILALLMAFGGGTARAGGPWYVSPTGNDGNNCLSSIAACLTIQAAVNKASSGDTINVAAGTYNEHVQIAIPLNLRGANFGVDGRGARSPESSIDGGGTNAAVAIHADNVTIDGFKIQGGQTNLNSGVWIITATKNWQILNNVITDNTIGVFAQCGGACLLQHNLFDGNNRPGSADGSGVYTEVSNGLTIDQNEFKNHTINSPIIFAATASSVHLNLTFTGNSIHDNFFGVYALGISGGTFSGNTFANSTHGTGLGFQGGNSNITVTGNTFSANQFGLRINDDGFGFGNNSDIQAHQNNFTGNVQFGVGVVGGYSGSLDATCNWWGAANGPGPVGPGTGDHVSTNVTYKNWLVAPAPGGACGGGLTFTVNASVFGRRHHGKVSPAAQTVNYGNSASVRIIPRTGYHIVSITDNSISMPKANPYVISNVTANHTIVVTFARTR